MVRHKNRRKINPTKTRPCIVERGYAVKSCDTVSLFPLQSIECFALLRLNNISSERNDDGGEGKIQDSRSLYYLVREITLWQFDIPHNNKNKHRKLRCKIVPHTEKEEKVREKANVRDFSQF